MNKEQLETIKERVANATPGEWSTELCYDRLIGTYLLLTDKGELVLSTYDNPTKQDAKFIAHARQDIPALIAEVERLQRFEQKAIYVIEENKRLQKQHDALEFHLKVSSKALESEGAKADKFQIALEKIYDDIGILTSQEIYRIIEDALEGAMSLGGD